MVFTDSKLALPLTTFALVKTISFVVTVPVVVRLEGNNAELGAKLLDESGLKLISANGLSDAAEKVVAAVKA